MRGSPIGVGSDIAGSVRIPADFNGLFGLRPSYDRIPYQDALNSAMGQESIPSVFGPLCPTIEGIKAFFKAIIDGKPWLRDPYSPRLPWSEDLFQLKEQNGGKGLVFGFLWNDTQITPHPPIQRAMRITKDALVAAGHKGR
jgi:amidase